MELKTVKLTNKKEFNSKIETLFGNEKKTNYIF